MTGGLDSFYSAQGTNLQPSPMPSQNQSVPANVTTDLNQQVTPTSALKFESLPYERDQSVLLRANKGASLLDIGSLFGGQNSSLGNFLDQLA